MGIMTPPKHPLWDGLQPQTLPGDTEVAPARPSPGSSLGPGGGDLGTPPPTQEGASSQRDGDPSGTPAGGEGTGEPHRCPCPLGVGGALGARTGGSLPPRGTEGLGGDRVWCWGGDAGKTEKGGGGGSWASCPHVPIPPPLQSPVCPGQGGTRPLGPPQPGRSVGGWRLPAAGGGGHRTPRDGDPADIAVVTQPRAQPTCPLPPPPPTPVGHILHLYVCV